MNWSENDWWWFWRKQTVTARAVYVILRVQQIAHVFFYCMAVCYKDWELSNWRISLDEIGIKSGLDFPIKTGICTNYILWLKKLQTKMQKYWLFSSSNIYLWKCQKAWREKKSIADEQTLAKFYSAHRLSQAKCKLVQTSYIKRIQLLLFLPYNKHLIYRTTLVCMGESWHWSRVQTSLRSICTYDLGQDSPI